MIELKHVTLVIIKSRWCYKQDITIPDGENVGILGESGCGKKYARFIGSWLCLNLLKEKFTK